jgi:hypothetical protein
LHFVIEPAAKEHFRMQNAIEGRGKQAQMKTSYQTYVTSAA